MAPTEKIARPRVVLPEVTVSDRELRYRHLLSVSAGLSPIPIAVAHPCDRESLLGPVQAAKAGLVDPILKSIAANLDATPSEVSLLFTSYLLVTGLAMLVTSWISSRIGAKATLLIGLALIVVFALMVGPKAFPHWFPDPRLPLTFLIGSTIALFTAVGYWNDYFSSVLYINTKSRWSLQAVLRYMLTNTNQAMQSAGVTVTATTNVTAATIKAASVVVATVPILCVYPFVQKYFVKGITIGSVKG